MFERLKTLPDYLSSHLPDSLCPSEAFRADFRTWIQTQFEAWDFVLRTEFDTQARLLAQTQAHLDELEVRIKQLEKQP